MADLAASDVTYTVDNQFPTQGGVKKYKISAAFGDGALTYPTGGVPLTKAKMGVPNVIQSLTVMEAAAGNGFLYKYDESTAKIRIYQGDNDNAADAALIELVGGAATPAAATLSMIVHGY